MEINLKNVKSNYSKIKVILLTLILGLFGIDDLYLKKYFRFIFKLTFFIIFIVITILAIIELQKIDSAVEKMIAFAKQQLQSKIDANEGEYTSAQGAIKLIAEVFQEVIEKLIIESLTILITTMIWIFVTIVMVVVWIMAILATILGFRTDSFGLKIRFKGITFEQFCQQLIAQSVN